MEESTTTPTAPRPPASPLDPRAPGRWASDGGSPPPPPALEIEPPPPPLPGLWRRAALVVGAVSALVFGRVPIDSVGAALMIGAIAGALFLTGSVTSRTGRWCLLGAAGFGLLLAIRTDPRLVAFNVTAAALLLLVAVIGPTRVFDWRPLELLNDALSIVIQPFVMVWALIPGTATAPQQRPDRSERRQLIVGVVQGLVIAVPLLIVLAALLGSADVIFADFLSRGQFDATGLWYTSLRFLAGAALTVTLIGRTVGDRSDVPSAGLSLGRTPTLVVLTALNAMFALFVAAQLYALTSAGEQILTEAGLTYSDYARQGFFQLLWVAGLTLLVLLSLRSAASGWFDTDRWFRWSSLVAVALTVGVVVVALGRLQLYIADFGLTPLRFYSSVFSLWVAAGFVIVAIRLVGWRTEQAWMLPALVCSGLVTLLALNLVNPEARVAHDLVERQDVASAMHLLTGDGHAVFAERFDDIAPAARPEVAERLCRNVPDDDGPLSWNLGRSRARSALLELC